ncbi:sigma-70 family RNA polymerase sigma factor [Altererythrobacter aurantiacus]|uniref:RNA polymerase sigma factor n=1 Tax=Parapontixanthobacter aurantiacus TaxID=1463599 RepID=A0A844ZL96_9SPHN|nr:sigma-70 family RNA polymerase sigma factor [Parapontixanthobacter aurantiacus]MXO86449.1 sigma-70 family RNA polymerase sigma factor [Parapontixanthobacter aurantiacus]
MSERRELLLKAISETAEGDRSSLKTVYEMTSGKVFATIVRIVRDRERSEDILQEVFVKVWSRAGRFDPAKGSPITWLCTIARNTALNDIRRSDHVVRTPDGALPEITDDEARPADEWLCAMEDSEALARCLEELQDDHRRSIKLAFFDGLTHSQLADRVNVPLGTMKSWIRRGLAGLRSCLGG